MNKKEYLNEEQYQKINKKVNLIGNVLLVLEGLSFIICSILIFGNFIDFELRGLISNLWVFSASLAGFGFMFYINSFKTNNCIYGQQQMTVAKESVEKMSPAI